MEVPREVVEAACPRDDLAASMRLLPYLDGRATAKVRNLHHLNAHPRMCGMKSVIDILSEIPCVSPEDRRPVVNTPKISFYGKLLYGRLTFKNGAIR